MARITTLLASMRARAALLTILVLAGLAASALLWAQVGPLAGIAIAALVVAMAAVAKGAMETMRDTARLAQRVEATTSRLDALDASVAGAATRVDDLKRGLEMRVQRLAGQTDAERERLTDTRTRLSTTESELRSTKQWLTSVGERLETERQRLVETRMRLDEERAARTRLGEALDQEAERAAKRSAVVEELRVHEAETRRLAREAVTTAERERNDRILAFAGRDSRFEEVTDVLLIMAAHRTGSTLLFDLLRMHPAVRVEPTHVVWDALGLKGRRYPVALSDTAASTLDIEVSSGIGSRIPDHGRQLGRHPLGPFAVEKAHPQFYDFDDDAFLRALDRAQDELEARIHLVYGVRDPLESMWSMIEYQRRDPDWYAFLAPEDVPEFIGRSYRSLRTLAEARPGRVIDYTDLTVHDPSLMDLGRSLSTTADEDLEAWLSSAFERLSKRRQSSSQARPFIGEHSARPPDGPDGLWAARQETVERAVDDYEAIRAAASTS